RGAAEVLVELAGGRVARRLVGQSALVAQVPNERRGILGRPTRVLAPLVGAGFENPSFRRFECALPLEVKLKERQFDLLAVEISRLGIELNVAQRGAVRLSAVPAAV